MKRILYNIDEWFYALEIHQQLIYATALVTPLIAGVIVGNIVMILIGHVIYLLGLYIIEKGDAIRLELVRTRTHYLQTCANELIGHIMLEKKFYGKFKSR